MTQRTEAVFPAYLKATAFAACLVAGSIVPGVGFAATLSPLNAPADPLHHVGKVVLVELVTPDLEAAKTFYAGMFGWTFRDVAVGGAEYAEASLNGHQVAGIVRKDAPSSQRRQPAWLAFISASDVDAARKTALQGGAKVLSAPHDVPNRGREAVFSDPQGAVFAVLASSSGDPPDVLAAPGEWIWSSLATSDPDTGAAFYQSLFDYEVFELPSEPGNQNLMLASESFARASANALPANRPGAHAHWLNYVRVDDMGASMAKLAALGGRVLVEPRVDRHGGMVAVVADPLGAAFGLLEWKAGDGDEVGDEPRAVPARGRHRDNRVRDDAVGRLCGRRVRVRRRRQRRRRLLRAVRHRLWRLGAGLPRRAVPWLRRRRARR